jgi:hypothetical protein
MKESTVILQFNKLNNKINMMAKHLSDTEKHLQELYMMNNALSITLDATVGILVDSRIMTNEKVKEYVEKELDKRRARVNEAKDKEVESQPKLVEDESNIIMAEEIQNG